MENWFKDWFDENYLLLYRHRDQKDANLQFELILSKVKPDKNWKILDLACGEGRYTSLFKNMGFNVLGTDLSEILVKSGMEKYKGLHLETCDMRKIKGKFDMILSLFTSFGYFRKDEENYEVISGIYSSLNSGGVLWLDFLNPGFVRKSMVKKEEKTTSEGIRIIEERSIEGNRVVKRITFTKDDKEKKYVESVRLFTRDEMESILSGAGFHITGIYGNYRGEPWADVSPRMILHSQKGK